MWSEKEGTLKKIGFGIEHCFWRVVPQVWGQPQEAGGYLWEGREERISELEVIGNKAHLALSPDPNSMTKSNERN